MRHRPALSTALAAALLTTLLAAPALAENKFVGGVEGMLGFPGGYSNDGSAERSSPSSSSGARSSWAIALAPQRESYQNTVRRARHGARPPQTYAP